MRVKQYPHFLFVNKVNADSIQDADGNWIEQSTSEMVSLGSCREEVSGGGSVIKLADGEFHKYSSIVQMPLDIHDVKAGEEVVIATDELCENIRTKAPVIKFDRGQLHCRLWV